MNAYDLFAQAGAAVSAASARPRLPGCASAPRKQLTDPRRCVADNLRAALDVVGFGLLIADAAAKVLAANRAAHATLKSADGLRSYRGRLRCEVPCETRALHDAIRAAAEPGRLQGCSAIHVAVSRNRTDRPLTVHVVPLAPAAAGKHPPTAAAGVFLVDPTVEGGSAESFARAYRLTPSESRLVGHIIAGRGLVEAAERLSIAMPTARTHLQHIFSKTGTGNQTELVRLAVKSSLPLHEPI